MQNGKVAACWLTKEPILHINHSVHDGKAAHSTRYMHIVVAQPIKGLEEAIQVNGPVFLPPTTESINSSICWISMLHS